MGNFLVASDLHIGDWTEHSTFDEFDRPSRMLAYEQAARDIVKIAQQENSDYILVAGDISQAATQRPRVLSTIRNFFSTLSELEIPILVIYGQHDLDVKNIKIAKHNCILSIIEDIAHVRVFYEDQRLFLINRQTSISRLDDCIQLYARPWRPDCQIPLDTSPVDILLTHGIVSGTTNPQGYKFQNGFSVKELTKFATISIIGDVHNGKLIEEDSSYVLVPGQLLQNSYADSPECGLWTFSYDPTQDVEISNIKFHSIHDISPNTYHKFVYSEDAVDSKIINTHIKERIVKTATKKIDVAAISSASSLDEAAKTVINKSKINDKEEVLSLCTYYIEKLGGGKSKKTRNLKVSKIAIWGFLSIEHYVLDLEGLESKALVILGHTGSGKTSLVEAVYWGLTGKTTKGLSVNEVKNLYRDIDPKVVVTLRDEEDGSTYTVIRSRDHGSPSLEIKVNKGDKITNIKKSSTGETQAYLYEILGLSEDEIRQSTYFSSRNPVLYGGLAGTARNNLLARLVSLDEVDQLYKFASEDLDDEDKRLTIASTKLSSLLMNKSRLSSEMDRTVSSLETAFVDVGIRDFDKRIEEVERTLHFYEMSLEGEGRDIEAERRLRNEYAVVNDFYSSIQTAIQTKTKAITEVKSNLAKALRTGLCYTCGQKLPQDGQLIGTLTDRITTINEEISKESDKLKTINVKYDNKKLAYEEAKLNLERYQELHTKISAKTKELSNLRRDSPSPDLDQEIYKDRIKRLREELTTIENSIIQEQAVATRSEKRKENLNFLAKKLFHKTGSLNELLLGNAIELLSYEVDTVTASLPFSIHFDKSGSLSISLNGKMRNYTMLSEGQKRTVDVTLMVATNNLLAKTSQLDGGVLGLMIFDEILSYLDEEFADACIGSILSNSITEQIIVITHDARISSYFSTRLMVEYNGETSAYELIN